MTLLAVAFKTLGCKLNQLETESMADAFTIAGAELRSFDEKADLYVINTCTVTGKAEQKARRVIRQAIAQDPGAVVLVTGCYAQMDPQGLALLDPRALVLPGDEKSGILSLAGWLQENWQGHGDLFDAVLEWKKVLESGMSPDGTDRFAFHPGAFSFHSRPSLKIQDGCDNRCAYCRVCLARGPSVSLDPGEILLRARTLEAAGAAELVLTGINLSQYRSGSMRFPELLAFLISETSALRFRISSFEPERIDEAFLKVFAEKRVQPHVHLAVQSGSSAVLRRMARPYSAERVAKAVADLRSTGRDPFIAADMIVGFPGETDEEFRETLSLCEKMGFSWIHAFQFSARPGTRAFDMRPKVPERVAGERAALLAKCAADGKSAYIARWSGKTVDVILEKDDSNHGDILSPGEILRQGTTSNYLKAAISGIPDKIIPGTLISVRLGEETAIAGLDVNSVYIN
jgi:threonylcarbamoyladenosine tRNA methylthiotransferase MtaB